jgi:hypothetical protein
VNKFCSEPRAVVAADVVAGPAADVQAVPERVVGAGGVARHRGARRHQRLPAACTAAARQGPVLTPLAHALPTAFVRLLSH